MREKKALKNKNSLNWLSLILRPGHPERTKMPEWVCGSTLIAPITVLWEDTTPLSIAYLRPFSGWGPSGSIPKASKRVTKAECHFLDHQTAPRDRLSLLLTIIPDCCHLAPSVCSLRCLIWNSDSCWNGITSIVSVFKIQQSKGKGRHGSRDYP